MVSIIPGMDARAPERTETRRGFSLSPNFLPVIPSILSMYSGADFIKTSTGKQQPAATPEAAYVMCQAIKEYYEQTGIKVGFKPAGGINCVNDALIYYTIVKEVLGDEWLTNKLFRLGTSRLANLLLSEIVGEDLKFF